MKKLLSLFLALTMVMGILVIVPFTASADTADDHLITHWNFAGNDPMADKALHGDSSDTVKLFGNASVSNGTAYIPDWASGNSNHYVYAENSDDFFRTTEDRTVYIVFKASKGEFDKDSGSSEKDFVELASQNGALRIGINDQNVLFASTNSHAQGENRAASDAMNTFVANTWTTVAVSYKKDAASNSFTVTACFKVGDGEWITSSVVRTDANQTWFEDNSDAGKTDTLNFVLGRRSFESASTWGGNLTIDDVRVYDAALTADEIKGITVTDNDPVVEETFDPADHLISHWNFAGSNPLADKATNGAVADTMQLSGKITVENGTAYVPDWANSNSKHYMYVENSADLFRTAEDRTLYIVFKSDKGDFANDGKTDFVELAGQNGAIRVGINDQNNLFASTNSHTQGENAANTTGMNTFVANTWTTVAVSYKKNAATNTFTVTTCYKVGDGEWITSSVVRTDANQTWLEDNSDAGKTDTMNFVLCRKTFDENSTWGGSLTIEDVRIYNKALSAEQITEIVVTNDETPAPVVPTVEGKGHSLTLDGNIGVNFLLAPNAEAADAVVTIKNGDTVLVENAKFDDAHKNGESYKFTAEVSAKEMSDELTLTVTLGEEVIYTDAYSVMEYGLYVIDHYSDYNTKTLNLVRAMLNYGCYTQAYFNYNTDKIGYTKTKPATLEATTAYDFTVSGSVAGLSAQAATLVLDSKTEITVAFAMADGAALADYTVTGGTAVEKDGVIYVTTAGVCAQDLDVMQTVTVTKGGETLTVSYAPMSYVAANADNSGSNVDLLVRALNDFRVAAEAYTA